MQTERLSTDILGITDQIEGFLHTVTADLTIHLLETQRDFERRSPLLEIGVYAGKYFSILLHESGVCGSRTAGIDTFQFFKKETVETNLRRLFPSAPFELHNARSDDFSAPEYQAKLGGEPRFISVDGSHMAPDVLHDLELSATILSGRGIIAVDDFLNPLTLGVNEAVARFMMCQGTSRLTPFCYCANKLFFCRPHMRTFYAEVTEKFARANASRYSEFARFVDLDAKWRGAVEIDYFGARILVF